ncbi:MAG: DsbE family thiol:disulfide interchange protein [Paracoccus sp. (in: a-proteobacteria)]|uniref:DsbE family thiol:disulfide interchange protein n=1 Tax=Paracoccus sp. TaxID=267 RepID=UPI0026E05D98|nr:DsbE family thiol:disulfide interchange protein [Paracoccus sp. (in: a-proteobacteria)]MDO5620125.1 DsbE family thiol:disulfide interchange protein [Paracoccus sp. (in: a-proteobacteria)]
MAKIPPLAIIPPLAFAVLAGIFVWGMARQDPNSLPSALIGKEAPAVETTTFAGQPGFSDATLRDGQVKLVNFWASWCAPCRVEHPILEALDKQGVTILGVNYKDDARKADGFLRELGNPFAAVGSDPQGRMALDWGVYGVPETFVVDGDGKVLYRFAGPLTPQLVERDIRPLLN